MGDVGSAADGRAAGDSGMGREPDAGGILREGDRRRGDGVESNADGISADDGSGRKEERRVESEGGDTGRGGVGAWEFKEVGGKAWGREAGVGEHVRDNGDDGACDISEVEERRRGEGGAREPDRKSVGRSAGVRK